MRYLIFKVVTGMLNKITFMTLLIKNTHDWSNDKSYECRLLTFKGEFLQNGLNLFYSNQKAYYLPISNYLPIIYPIILAIFPILLSTLL